MLGKWSKMGHGKGFRTFQEQSIQRASVLIYEICVPVVRVMAVCECESLYVCLWVYVLACICVDAYIHAYTFGTVCNSVYTCRCLFMFVVVCLYTV